MPRLTRSTLRAAGMTLDAYSSVTAPPLPSVPIDTATPVLKKSRGKWKKAKVTISKPYEEATSKVTKKKASSTKTSAAQKNEKLAVAAADAAAVPSYRAPTIKAATSSPMAASGLATTTDAPTLRSLRRRVRAWRLQVEGLMESVRDLEPADQTTEIIADRVRHFNDLADGMWMLECSEDWFGKGRKERQTTEAWM